MVLQPIEIVEEFRAVFGYVLQQDVEIVMSHLASQAERAGSIPATRSSKPRKALRPIRHCAEPRSFTGSFTASVREPFWCSL